MTYIPYLCNSNELSIFSLRPCNPSLSIRTILIWLPIYLSRWLHGQRCGHVLETDASTRRGGRRTATVHDHWLRDKRSQGASGDGSLSASVAVVQAAAQHRLLCVPDIFAQHTDCDAVVGLVLDQSRGDQCPCGTGHYHRADDDHDQHGSAELIAAHLLCEGHRYLSGHVLCVRLCRITRVCGRQLYVLGQAGQEENQKAEGL